MAAAAIQNIIMTTNDVRCTLKRGNIPPHTVSYGAGDPTAFAGEVTDPYTDTTNTKQYVCTTAGAAGAAVWTVLN